MVSMNKTYSWCMLTASVIRRGRQSCHICCISMLLKGCCTLLCVHVLCMCLYKKSLVFLILWLFKVGSFNQSTILRRSCLALLIFIMYMYVESEQYSIQDSSYIFLTFFTVQWVVLAGLYFLFSFQSVCTSELKKAWYKH